RPWAYRQKPSLPAFNNERVNLAIRDRDGKDWFLSIVGGPIVGSIRMLEGIVAGRTVTVGEKLATFELGSTCCMVSPVNPSAEVGHAVAVGDPLEVARSLPDTTHAWKDAEFPKLRSERRRDVRRDAA
ncbi:MAG: phosphatidylserine decarboxylase, partial [Bdellovibrionales bacterium]|nr:phosphatidylserine decarboxylase [Bdellovibrionales bacterium]